MAHDWILSEPLKILQSEDQPYLETALATLGGHEIAVNLSKGRKGREGRVEFNVFLDGYKIYELGDKSVSGSWFTVCQELGYDPEVHWDWDPADLLFRSVIPRMAAHWHEIALPANAAGVPDGVISLAVIRCAYDERIKVIRKGKPSGAEAFVADLFGRLPLRAVLWRDDPMRRVDYLGNAVDEPLLGVFLVLGSNPASAVFMSRAMRNDTGGIGWSPWLLGGDWVDQGRDFASSLKPSDFLKAADLPLDQVPEAFQSTFLTTLNKLMSALEPWLEEYRENYPFEILWHRDPKARFLHRTIVDVRFGDRTILVLDDGTEIPIAGTVTTHSRGTHQPAGLTGED